MSAEHINFGEPLINKYRPQEWDDILGHDSTIAALRRAIESTTRPHAYLFTGPAGTGKTTTARITAATIGCEFQNIPAAVFSGVDDMKALVELGGHRSLSGAGKRAFIIDECHSLSKAAWNTLLEILEEPPEHLFFMLCTTDLVKVPVAAVTRCYHVKLTPLSIQEMMDLLDAVAGAEGWDVTPGIYKTIVQAAGGSARLGISMLQSVHGETDLDEVKRIISLTEASSALIDLCKFIMKGKTAWASLQPFLAKLEADDFETGLIGAGRYVAQVMMTTKSEPEAQRCWALLDAMTFPTTTYDRKVHFITAIGRIVFA